MLLKKYDNTNAMANGIGGLRARGTSASPAALQTNDRYFSLIGAAYDGSAFSNDAAIQMYAGENHSTAAHGSFMSFETAANGETVRSERIRIDSAGGTLIGNTSSYPFAAQGWGNFNLLVNSISNKNGVGIDATGG